MAFDPIRRLAEARVPVHHFNDRQREILSSLTEWEVDVLCSVTARLDASASEVEGQDANVFISE